MKRGMRALAALLLIMAAGCAPKTKNADPAAVTNEAIKTNGTTGAAGIKVGLVTDAGGIDDQSFNASSWAGLKKAKDEFKIEARYLESREQSDYKTNLSSLADQGNNLVFAVGFLMEDALKEVAPRYANTKFAIIDGSAPAAPNAVSLKFREEEGCFLAGYLAGKVSKTGAIAFVGGMESPLMKRFESGYIAGARTARADIRVLVKYVGNWTDVPKGKELGLSCIKSGADILFAAAGKGGLGALDAINEKGEGFYGIGVDADQDGLHPGRILTSMMKRVDTAVYDTVKSLKDNQWKAGEHVFGLKEGGVGLSPMRYTKDKVPAEVMQQIEALSKKIADGAIKVPRTDEELQNFNPPKT